MKSLLFVELLLVSVPLKRARRIKFHRRATIIRGGNETGKSALLKCLYWAFGAPPADIEKGWIDAEVKILVRFDVDGIRYSIFRDGDSYTLFNRRDEVLGVYRNVIGGLDRALADLFNFRLQFSSPSGDSRQAHPRYLFAPFYVDQDRGWISPWASLAKLRTARRKDALEYHVGIRPNDFFIAKARLQDLQEEIRKPRSELDAMRAILSNLDERLGLSIVTINESEFRKELEQLVARSAALREAQDAIRNRTIALENERLSLYSQLELTQKAIAELDGDYGFANTAPPEIECPTCGAHYQNSVAQTFLIAQDEDECIDMASRLQDLLGPVEERLAKTQAEFESLGDQVEEVNKLVSVRRGELTLREVIQAEGKREVHSVLSRDIERLSDTVSQLSGDIHEARGVLKSFEDRDTRNQIMAEYAGGLRDNAIKLGVSPLPKEMLAVLDPRIAAGGSDLPRRLLAYYVTILHLIKKRGSATYCPMVVDSVNQQDQAEENLVRMFELLATGLPPDTQLVLACVNTRGVKFEAETIVLTEKFALLRLDEYGAAADEVRPLIDKRFQYEQQQSESPLD